jgi:transcriptional activator of cad operon
MERTPITMLRVGDWCVNPVSGQISRNGEASRVEVRTMRLLLCLAEHAGEVVSIDDLLSQVWSDVTVAPDSVYQAVTSLRRLLGDDPKQPTYIATVPRLGYRMVATVGPWLDQRSDDGSKNLRSVEAAPANGAASHAKATDGPTRFPRFSASFLLAAGAAICLALLIALVFYGRLTNSNRSASPTIASSQPPKSIAVLPFLDLTEKMSEEPFADGMTEELIDKLSKIPGLQVPPPTSSFYYKGKQMTVADIAKALGVTYVLDGSVRKSGTMVRVAARLIRADNGYVIWSETYDHSWNDMLMVQDDIATEVTKALRASIEAKPEDKNR